MMFTGMLRGSRLVASTKYSIRCRPETVGERGGALPWVGRLSMISITLSGRGSRSSMALNRFARLVPSDGGVSRSESMASDRIPGSIVECQSSVGSTDTAWVLKRMIW